MTTFRLGLVSSWCALVAPITVLGDQWLYFNAGDIKRARTDGTNLEVIVRSIPNCEFLSVAVDSRDNHVYFVEACTISSGTIIDRVDDRGGNRQRALSAVGGYSVIEGIAVDSVAGALYFGFRLPGGEIHRKRLQGDAEETLVRGAGSNIWGVALDSESGTIYWTTADDGEPPVGRLRRANLDGTNVHDFVVGLGSPRELAIDTNHGKIYWADDATKRIQRADLVDGRNVESIVSDGVEGVFGLALDVSAGKIYWADSGLRKIRRANLDGSGAEDVLTGIAAGPLEIGPNRVVSVEPSSWSKVKRGFRR